MKEIVFRKTKPKFYFGKSNGKLLVLCEKALQEVFGIKNSPRKIKIQISKQKNPLGFKAKIAENDHYIQIKDKLVALDISTIYFFRENYKNKTFWLTCTE